MCNLSWTPHSNLEKDNSLKTTPVLAQRWAVWSILTKDVLERLRSCCGCVIKSLVNLLIDMQTKCNIVSLMQQRMMLYTKNGNNIYFYFQTLVAYTTIKLTLVYIL